MLQPHFKWKLFDFCHYLHFLKPLEGKMRMQRNNKKRAHTECLYILEKKNYWIFDEPYSHRCTILRLSNSYVSLRFQPNTGVLNARFWIMREYLVYCQSLHMFSLWKVNHPQLSGFYISWVFRRSDNSWQPQSTLRPQGLVGSHTKDWSRAAGFGLVI